MPESRRRWAAWLLMLASGAAGLGYQIVWTEQASLWLGHESAAVLAVVTAFFGGLALGGFMLGPRVEQSARPVRWYAACELVVALWSLLLLALWSPCSDAVMRLTGPEPSAWWQWTVAFSATFLLLSPATVAMGATLPAMHRLSEGERSVAGLYASNTLGAVLGVLAAAFVAIPWLGLARTTWVAVSLNLLCSGLALYVFSAAPEPAPRSATNYRATWRLAVTGLLGIGYEIVVVRVLSQVSEDTVYTFALVLAVYLVGSAAGALAYRRWGEGREDSGGLTDSLLAALALACLLGGASAWAAERVKELAAHAFGHGFAAAIGAEAFLALAVFALPTFVMGALFSHLTRVAQERGASFGKALGVNLLAGALAPLLFGVVMLPQFGAKMALVAISFGFLACCSRASWRQSYVLVPLAATVGVALLAPPLTFVEVPEGGRVISYQEGSMAAVSVVEDADGVSRLRINNRQQEGSSASLRVDARQAWLPLLLHPGPRRALFLGLGSGVTASSAAVDPTLEVEAVELLPEVVTASHHFTDQGSRLHVHVADARRYVRASSSRYDVIVSDNFHPARSGSGALYTVEHFQAVQQRLSADGVFCQWLPLHQLDLGTFRSIARSFLQAFPRAIAIVASNSLETPVVGLVGRAPGATFALPALQHRLATLALPEQVRGLGLEDELAVLGAVIAGSRSLAKDARLAPLNTDDHPVVMYSAPRITYVPDSTPADRFLQLLSTLSADPSEVLASPDSALAARLVAYFRARDRFIASGRNVVPSPRVEEMLAQVQQPLLSVLQISPDFRPAYDPLLGMASALLRSNVSGARALLTQLSELQPARTEASQLLRAAEANRH